MELLPKNHLKLFGKFYQIKPANLKFVFLIFLPSFHSNLDIDTS